MKILFHRGFEKAFHKIPNTIKRKFKERLVIFEANPFHPLLGNHMLSGKYKGYRSISVGGDFRAIYKLVDGDNYWFIDIGTHT
jgi:addiction module RelE/StbE family toxin